MYRILPAQGGGYPSAAPASPSAVYQKLPIAWPQAPISLVFGDITSDGPGEVVPTSISMSSLGHL